MLEFKGENRSILLPFLLHLVGLENVRVVSTNINKNNLSARLRLDDGIFPVEVMKTSIPENYGFGFNWNYDQSWGSRPVADVSFGVRRGVEKLDWIFELDEFHMPVPVIFTPGSIDGKLAVDLGYKCPPGFWKALPDEFIRRISRFDFSGPHFHVSWPRKDQYSQKFPEELGVGVYSGNFFANDEKSKTLQEKLKDYLVNTRFVSHKSETRRSPSGMDTTEKFEIVPEGLNKQSLQVLEDISAIVVKGVAVDEHRYTGLPKLPYSEIGIYGEFDRAVFLGVYPEFDGCLLDGSRVMGNVNGSSLAVAREHKKTKLVYQNPSFEDVEALMHNQFLFDLSSIVAKSYVAGVTKEGILSIK